MKFTDQSRLTRCALSDTGHNAGHSEEAGQQNARVLTDWTSQESLAQSETNADFTRFGD